MPATGANDLKSVQIWENYFNEILHERFAFFEKIMD